MESEIEADFIWKEELQIVSWKIKQNHSPKLPVPARTARAQSFGLLYPVINAGGGASPKCTEKHSVP